MPIKSTSKPEKTTMIVVLLGAITLYLAEAFIPNYNQFGFQIFSIGFSLITIPAILQTVFETQVEKLKTQEKNTNFQFLRIISSILFISLLWYFSIFLGAVLSLLLLGFHFGENDLKLNNQYFWNLSYGFGLIGLYICHNWNPIVNFAGEHQLLSKVQINEMIGFTETMNKFKFIHLIFIFSGIFISWDVKRSVFPILLILIPLSILIYSPVSSLVLYLFIWKPTVEKFELSKLLSTPTKKKLIYLTIGLIIGLISVVPFENFSAGQTMILAFMGILLIIPYITRSHEIIKIQRKTELFRKISMRRELKEERQQIELIDWEKSLINKIQFDSIKYKEPNKI
jgi:hypothetical protein